MASPVQRRALVLAVLASVTVGTVLVVACGNSDDDDSGKTGADAGKDSSIGPSADAAADSAPLADSAPGDASASDAGGDGGRVYSTDPATFFGDSRCASAGVLFCDGFEESVLDSGTGGDWAITSGGGGTPITLDETQAARGTGSIHVLMVAAGSSRLTLQKIFPVTGDRYFGRVFAKFHQIPRPPMTYAHWTIAAGSGTGVAGETRVSSEFNGVRDVFSVGTDNRTDGGYATGDWTNDDKDPGPDSGPDGGPEPIPVDQWVCLEWMNDGTAEQTRFWWDGVEHPSLATSETVHGGNQDIMYILPQYTQAWIGLDEYSDAGSKATKDAITFELWLDEIAYDTERIGCSN